MLQPLLPLVLYSYPHVVANPLQLTQHPHLLLLHQANFQLPALA
jgi:hypothetical protein